MSIVIADEKLVEALAAATGKVKVQTPDGRVLGTFTRSVPLPPDFDWGISDEELRRRVTDPTTKWYTLPEMLAKLTAL